MLLLTPSSLLTFLTIILRTLLALTSSNWFIAWIAIEINLLRFIPLIVRTKLNQETEASIKYFLAQALGSALILLSSISIWYITIISNWWLPLLIISLLLKLGGAPCHFWFPSVITSLSWSNALLLATWQKLAPLRLICFPTMNSTITNSLATLVASINALVGGILGINQTHLRTLLAYSSITHIGWIISAICANNPNSTIIYFLFYTIITIPIFLMLDSIKITRSSQFLSLVSYSKFILLGILVLLISLAGLPPLTGFIPKWFIILTLINSNHIVLIPLLLGSYLNLFFYLNLTFNGISSIRSHSTQTVSITPNTWILVLPGTRLLGVIPALLYAMTFLN